MIQSTCTVPTVNMECIFNRMIRSRVFQHWGIDHECSPVAHLSHGLGCASILHAASLNRQLTRFHAFPCRQALREVVTCSPSKLIVRGRFVCRCFQSFFEPVEGNSSLSVDSHRPVLYVDGFTLYYFVQWKPHHSVVTITYYEAHP